MPQVPSPRDRKKGGANPPIGCRRHPRRNHALGRMITVLFKWQEYSCHVVACIARLNKPGFHSLNQTNPFPKSERLDPQTTEKNKKYVTAEQKSHALAGGEERVGEHVEN